MIQRPWRQILRVALLALPLLTGLAPATAEPWADAWDACKRGDCATLMEMIRSRAEQGDAEAQYALGFAYANGEGVVKDEREAARWYRLAAEQGHAQAQVNLGVAYTIGRGLAKDEREAVRWYRLAAEQGHATAQFNLGVAYGLGQGVAKDFIRAYLWFNLAAAQGHEKAGELRELAAKEMTRDQVAEAQRLSSAWRPKKGGVPKRE